MVVVAVVPVVVRVVEVAMVAIAGHGNLYDRIHDQSCSEMVVAVAFAAVVWLVVLVVNVGISLQIG